MKGWLADIKGERRFIATIARRLDSLGAITRGQRDGRASMGDNALVRAEDNLESTHALSALRLMYLSIHNDHVPGWPEKRFQEATGRARAVRLDLLPSRQAPSASCGTPGRPSLPVPSRNPGSAPARARRPRRPVARKRPGPPTRRAG